MKKLFSTLMIALSAIVMVSCASAIDKDCAKMAEALQAGNWEEVATLAESTYEQIGECSAKNLADLTITYQLLALQSTDNATRYDYVTKFLECYEAGIEKDASVMKKNGEVAGVDLAALAQQYTDMLPQFEAAMNAEGE